MHTKTIYSRDFILVAVGQIVSLFGNQMLRYALPLYLLGQTGSSALFGTVLAFSFIPMLLLFPIGGVLADRLNKRNIMVTLDFATALLILAFYLLVGTVDIVPLMVVTLMILYGIQGAYQPAVKASVPALVDDIMRGNSVVDLISSLAGMIGPVLGGILYSAVGLVPILYVSMGCFFLSAVMEAFIHIPFERRPSELGLIATGFGDLRQSFHFVLRERPVLWKLSCIYASVNLLLSALVLIGVPVIVTQHLGVEPAVANRLYGYGQGVMAGGAVLGGLLAGALSRRIALRTGPRLLVGCGLCTLVAGAALHLLRAPMMVYLLMVTGCGLMLTLSTLFQIQMMTHLQQLTPAHLTGKVIACVICICMCTNPVGQMLYGFVFEWVGSCVYLPFYGAALMVIAIGVGTRGMFREMEQPA